VFRPEKEAQIQFSKQRLAIHREGQLAAEQLASGVTLLGRASSACPGLYTQAFFALTTGLERLAKLILIADHAITHSGRFPTNHDLRDAGHKIFELLRTCEKISRRHQSGLPHANRPNHPIHECVISVLTEFAEDTRYYNLNLITGANVARLSEPLTTWWERVGRPILKEHYDERQRKKDQAHAAGIANMLSPAFVLHHSEEGRAIWDVRTLMDRRFATRIVQTYGRLYTMQIIRWLAYLVSEVSELAAHQHNVEAFYGLSEFFPIFMNQDDAYLKKRRTWSIYNL
jgi:hypothetical protein